MSTNNPSVRTIANVKIRIGDPSSGRYIEFGPNGVTVYGSFRDAVDLTADNTEIDGFAPPRDGDG